MTLLAKVGAFNSGTGAIGTTVPVTGVGFQPKAIIFWYSGRTESVDTVGALTTVHGVGFVTSTTDRRTVSGRDELATAAATTASASVSTACIVSNSDTAVDGLLDLQSFDSDGFTLVVDDVMPADRRIHYLALGGADLTNVVTGQTQEPAAAGTVDVTAPGFQPDCVIFISRCSDVAEDGAVDNGNGIQIGVATANLAEATLCAISEDGSANMDTWSYCFAGECIGLLRVGSGIINGRAELSTMLSNGFRLNWLEVAAAAPLQRYVQYLALKGGQYLIGDLLTQTDTTTQIVESGFGFQPVAALLASHCLTQSTQDVVQAVERFSLGAFSSATDRGCQAVFSDDGTAAAEPAAAVEHDELYANIDSADAIQGLMDIVSVDSGGFTCIMDDADPAQAFVWYLAFGSSPVGGATYPGWYQSEGGWF